MSTITIDPAIYQWTELYAKMHNVSVQKLVERILLNTLGDSFSTNEQLQKSCPVKPYSIAQLRGIMKSDISGEKLVDEYLDEKYGL